MLQEMRPTLKHIAIILLLCFLLLPWPISSASVYEETDSAINYTMSYPIVYLDHNQEAQDRINSDIYNYIGTFRTDYNNGRFISGLENRVDDAESDIHRLKDRTNTFP